MKSNIAVGKTKPTVSGKFPSNTPTVNTPVGGVTYGTVLADKEATEILVQMLVVYQNPMCLDFKIAENSPQSPLIEVGVALSGFKYFLTNCTNPENIQDNSISITDLTANTVLASNLSKNTNLEYLNIGTIANTFPITRQWRLSGLNTKNQIFISSIYTINSIYPTFFGVSNSVPTANQALINSGTKLLETNGRLQQSTGTLNVTFGASGQYLWFAHPASNTTKTKWYVNALNNGNIGTISDLFNAPTTVNIDSPTVMWNGIAYKIYISNIPTTTTGNMELKNS